MADQATVLGSPVPVVTASAHDSSATSRLSVVLAPLIPSSVGCLLWAWGNPRHELDATPRGGSWTVTFYRMKESSSQLIRVPRGSRGGPCVRVFEYRRAYRCIGAGSHHESSRIWEFGGSIEDRYRGSILHARRPDGETIIRISIGSARAVRAAEVKTCRWRWRRWFVW